MNRAGDYKAARRAVEGTAKRIRSYAGRDPELQATASALEADIQQFQAPMAAPALKTAFAGASYLMRSRMPDGKAMKTPEDAGQRS